MPTVTLDHPLVRNLCHCPLCASRKDQGLLVCWQCYRAYGFRNGPSARVAECIDVCETDLAAAYAANTPPNASQE